MADSWLKANDTAPRLTSTLKDRDGDPVDLADAGIALFVAEIHGEQVVADEASNDQVGDGTDGSKGMVSYDFPEPLEPGGYRYEWQVTYLDTSVETFPNSGYLTLAVLADLGEVAS
jgi:hypothetical protein